MQKMMMLIAGGACGTVARYALSQGVHRIAGAGFPFGTLAVNTLGCLLIGFISVMAEQKLSLAPELRFLMLTGFLGAFTTFSTLIYESGQLAQNGQSLLGAVNLLGSLALGVAAWWMGSALASTL